MSDDTLSAPASTPPRISAQGWLGVGLIALCNALVLSWHIFSHANIHSVDGMYHIRYAWLYAQQGIFTDFPWMQFSIAQQTWADHHFLYHLLLIPFTGGDLLFGMKLSGVVFGALALTSCTLYLTAHRVRYAWVYGLILLLASDVFLFRVSMPRSISLSLIFLLLALWCLERRHDRSLFVIAFLYIWAYQTAVVLLPMAFVAVLWWRVREGAWVWQPLLYTTGGLVVGLTLNPFVPSSFSFFFFHFVPAFPGQAPLVVPLIPEWRGTTAVALWVRNYPAMVMGLVLPLVLWGKRKLWPQDIGILLAGTGALLLVSLRAERLLEYGVPFAVLLGARLFDAVWHAHAEQADTSSSPVPPVTPTPTPATSTPAEGLPAPTQVGSWQVPRSVLKVTVALLLVSFLWFGARKHSDFHRHAFDISPQLFRGAAHWLKGHTPAGTLVYHTDWASFSYLFFHNTHNYYLAGLSPLFMGAWKPKLYQSYRLINAGRMRDPVLMIRKLFRCRYVVLSGRRANFPLARQLLLHKQVKEVYSDQRVKVFDLGG